MATATSQLGDGAVQLKDASGQITDSMAAAGESLGSIAAERADRAEVASSPVSFTSSRVAPVTSEAAVAPVLAAAALWLGSIIIGCLLPASDVRAAASGRPVFGVLACGAGYAGASLLQALLVFGALAVTGVEASNPAGLVGLLALGALAFAGLAQALRLVCGRWFVPVSAALLVVQAVCAGGILPASLSAGVFSVLGDILPLPLLSQALRSVLAGSVRGVAQAALCLVVLLALAALASCASLALRRQVRPERVFAS